MRMSILWRLGHACLLFRYEGLVYDFAIAHDRGCSSHFDHIYCPRGLLRMPYCQEGAEDACHLMDESNSKFSLLYTVLSLTDHSKEFRTAGDVEKSSAILIDGKIDS